MLHFAPAVFLPPAGIRPIIKVSNETEEELAGIAGTASYEERRSLRDAVSGYIGKQVNLELKEDCEDVDIMMYGNTKHGSNTILDADGEWILVRVDSAKGSKEKLIRVGSVQRISLVNEK